MADKMADTNLQQVNGESERNGDSERNIDWEKLNSVLSGNTANALKEFLDSKEIDSSKSEKVEDSKVEIQKKYGKDPPNHVFKLQSYWEERFAEEDSYEWLGAWKSVRSVILPHLKPESRILIVGCGNSSFSADIYDEGYVNITNIDFSGVVIEKMKSLHESVRPSMKWIEMDMTKMTFMDESFDIVLDKAAMDALVVDEGDVWDPKEEVVQSVDRMCQSVSRVLTAQGIFLQISFAQPHFRTKYLIGYRADGTECNPYESHRGYSSRYNWKLDYEEVTLETGCLSLFFYTMRKE
jgi:SAM-dependent methyltransferase